MLIKSKPRCKKCKRPLRARAARCDLVTAAIERAA